VRLHRGPQPGRAVQVDPIKPTVKAHGIKRLKLQCGELLSSRAFSFNLRRYNLAAAATAIAAAAAPVFVSAKIAPGQLADPAAACDALLAALKLPCLDLLSFEWPTGDADTLYAVGRCRLTL
jgi:hypothetical protein